MGILSNASLNWSIDHLAKHSDTDIFPKGFEFQAIAHCREEVVAHLKVQDMAAWQVRPLRRCLTPKQRYGFRIATQLDPLDILIYLGLVYEIGEEPEAARLPPDDAVVFSSRFSPDAGFYLFNRELGFPQFQDRSNQLAAKWPYVVLTDIADFYPRIYFHRLENALRAKAPSFAAHATAILRLIKGWNQTVSYGIPVGNNPSRLLAEIVIDDVDRALLAEGYTFVRYVDDFRIFCQDRQQAYRALSRLANLLYDMHGLTLQAQKTKILPSERFVEEVLESEDRKELQSLADRFRAILHRAGVDDPYHVVDYDDLPVDLKAEVDHMNLAALLDSEIAKQEPEIPMVRLLINRLAWLNRPEPLWSLLENIDHLHPVCAEIVRYLASLVGSLTPETRHRVGALIMDKLDGSLIGQLEFNRMLLMGLFAGSPQWGNADRLARYYVAASDDWLRRSVLLALGKASQDYWLRAKKPYVESMSPWEKRAFLYAASCLPGDERRHWYSALRARLDPLEQWIVTWASQYPICS
jgi:hypothetical protein